MLSNYIYNHRVEVIQSVYLLIQSVYLFTLTCSLFQRHPDGVATVAFPDPESADVVVTAINNRVFYGRTIAAHTWDGKTKYEIKESEEEEKKRLAEWTKFLGEEETEAAKKPRLDESVKNNSEEEDVVASNEETKDTKTI